MEHQWPFCLWYLQGSLSTGCRFLDDRRLFSLVLFSGTSCFSVRIAKFQSFLAYLFTCWSSLKMFIHLVDIFWTASFGFQSIFFSLDPLLHIWDHEMRKKEKKERKRQVSFTEAVGSIPAHSLKVAWSSFSFFFFWRTKFYSTNRSQ